MRKRRSRFQQLQSPPPAPSPARLALVRHYLRRWREACHRNDLEGALRAYDAACKAALALKEERQ